MPVTSFAVNNRAITSRTQPAVTQDNQEGMARIDRYGGAYTAPIIRKQHLLADEGAYFTVNNAQSAITGSTGTAFSATACQLLIYNSDSPTNTSAKRIYVDYHHLLAGGTANSNTTSNTAMYYAICLDSGNRYSSAGSNLSANIVNANMDAPAAATIARVYFGAVVSTAATAARAVVGQRLFRAPVSATALSLINVDQWRFNFGGVESSPSNGVQASATVEATMVDKSFNLPPVVIGPNQSFLMHVWAIVNSAPVAGTYFPEVGWWER